MERLTKVVIVGGGVAALEGLLALRQLAEGRVAVELIAPQEEFVYRPLSVAEPFALGKASHYSLPKIASDNDATFTLGLVQEVDAQRKVVITEDGQSIEYDILLVAVGTQLKEALPGAHTFRGGEDVADIKRLLQDLSSGEVRRVAYVMPRATTWPLPLYELALMTAEYLQKNGLEDRNVVLVTPEEEPLMLTGEQASKAVKQLINESGIELYTATYPREIQGGNRLLTTTEGLIEADRVITLPYLQGPYLKGLPHNYEGFLDTNLSGKVYGVESVFAAGDSTSFPIKQGGLATQQADAAAESIAALAGAAVDPQPFKPVIRGMLLTGRQPRYLFTDIESDEAGSVQIAERPLWWPPAKIVGRYLAPYLASIQDVPLPGTSAAEDEGIPVEIEVDVDELAAD